MASLHLSQEIFKLIYPIGSIYMSTSSTNPGNIFGGTWEHWGKGRVPVSVDTSQTEFNTVNKTGGHKSMQSHNHTGSTGCGKTAFMRATFQVGDNISGNHTPSHGPGGYKDFDGGSFDWPGANHYHDFTTNNSGSGDSGNLQPYITCYMWRRTA